jgi:pyruvate,water dikinase
MRKLPVTVPPALVLAPPFVRRILEQNQAIFDDVRKLEGTLRRGEDPSNNTKEIRRSIERIDYPPNLSKKLNEITTTLIGKAERLGKDQPVRVAVRSSGLAEDLPTASFAGQYETVLNVTLEQVRLEEAILECLASVWGDRVVDYRQKLRDKGLEIPTESEICEKGLFSVILQIMVDSEFSGVGFSIETETGHQNVFKSTVWKGLGELGVQGRVPAAEIYAAKETNLDRSEIDGVEVETSVQALGTMPPPTPQREMMVWKADEGNVIVPVVVENPKIVDDEQAQLISYVTAYLQETVGKGKPVDVEFAWEKGNLYLLQVRPETVHVAKLEAVIETYILEEQPPEEMLIGKGLNVGTKIATSLLAPIDFGGIAKEKLTLGIRLLRRVLTKLNQEHDAKPILFAEMTSPPWEPIMKRDLIGGIITEFGNRTSHPAIISREEGLPCGVGVQGLSQNLDKLQTTMYTSACTACDYTGVMEVDGEGSKPPEACPGCGGSLFNVGVKEAVTFDCSIGEARVYKGKYKYVVERRVLEELPRIETGVAVNCGSPLEALNVSQIPGVQKVGLAREEFIAAWIQVHPTFCIVAQKIRDEGGFWAPEVQRQFPGETEPKREWIDRLTLGIGLIGAAFYPREVIFRLSDFKTNEYATLIGAMYYTLKCPKCGKGIALTKYVKCPICDSSVESKRVDIEPKEANPMIGWRGVSRYLDPGFHEAFMMEVEALINVYEKGLNNVIPMYPFVRHPEEARSITDAVNNRFREAGMEPPKTIFMAEVPSMGFVPYLFNPYCDGYSLGTNDYTQLVTGTDRDSPRLPFNEDVPSVRMAIAMLADSAHREDPPREIGVCGQAPSDLPAFLRFLAIYLDYVSVNPDAVVKTIQILSEVEGDLRKLCRKGVQEAALELSKEYDLRNPFNPREPGVTMFRVEWLKRKLGLPS